MAARLVMFFLVLAVLLPAAKKTVGTARGENEDLILNVTLYIDAAGVKELIGDDLGGHYIVAQVKVEPKYGKDITIDRDDFQLRTDNGQIINLEFSFVFCGTAGRRGGVGRGLGIWCGRSRRSG